MAIDTKYTPKVLKYAICKKRENNVFLDEQMFEYARKNVDNSSQLCYNKATKQMFVFAATFSKNNIFEGDLYVLLHTRNYKRGNREFDKKILR
jgi:hypothetical protein